MLAYREARARVSIDQIVDERIELPYDRGPMLAALLPERRDAGDRSIRAENLGSRAPHLALRRTLFATDHAYGSGPLAIPAGARPTLADLLLVIAGAEPFYFTLLGNLLAAGVEAAAHGSALSEAGVDLNRLLDAAEMISAIDEHRSVIGHQETERLRRLQP